ncbi:phosphoribosyltransferase family protein [Ferruginibacter paludis]|uniref:ComF family protein n=1 Tax=Ferruginibacter TaxID=1004303 RepID=UPI0025B59AB4|nr:MULTISPECIES: phosphoribosyltransferase family protein [Ferruginibacter]MDN3659054.1 phosphoribosyltransferase family protein [Ferruginibacter paludis]
MKCITNLPTTNFALYANNPVEKIFWGRIPLTAAHSEYYFSKNALIQQLIHQLKYKRNTSIGMYLGELMGKSLVESNRFDTVDALIPLPLYPDKERKRGYNQAAIICDGMSSVMNIPVIKNNVLRQRYTDTQTKKHRIERWENVAGSFTCKIPGQLSGKHLLLVDDVVTTGATLEACGSTIAAIENVQLSIATLAHAPK